MSGPGTLLVALTPQSFPVPFLVAGTIIGGFGAVLYNIQQVSLRQAITPERMQGRMNSVMRFLVWGPIPLGALAGGAIASTFGLRTALVVGAVGGFTSTIPILLLADPQAEGHPGVGGGAAHAGRRRGRARADRHLRHRRERRPCRRRGGGGDGRGLTRRG